ncbi:S1 family peptidase [Serratia marcescens]|uniref:S1 family peptidase n=1 Tax=Serratia TaxID=613 RepID=UPI0013147450|nr:serine protease [Serratia marcescens]EIY8599116.1 trypsin-like peptidase domain-containing protein [Serratia marcescens]EIY8856863.1 trypsin-like peptidase domain-containing protein [Serratia marcescens]EIY8863975.1 trypsin-like peptidase domain-containing protein [Serratia marcescens]ELH4238927.1 trypsin-like peptidase domain-containing protein [Serratia marcescens]ELM0003382.1 trypsin-like peptidase domain-containing protein [Serratia marcescens]
MDNVNQLSLITTLVSLKDKGVPVSIGTGFFYQDVNSGTIFLVTNYHVISGVSPGEGRGFLGDEIEFSVRRRGNRTRTISLPLLSNDEKVWLEHPTDKHADLVMIPLRKEQVYNADILAVSQNSTMMDLHIEPSSSAVLIGYPHGYHDIRNMLPIWKTGSIASEPEYDFDGKKIIVIDVSAFPGMSGSPAFYVSHGGYKLKDGSFNYAPGMTHSFIGIYASMQMINSQLYLEDVSNSSGQMVVHSESLQLGHIWKSSLIHDIVNSFNLDLYLQRVYPNRTMLPSMVGGPLEFKF